MTDPHLFDAGSARHGEGVAEEALDNRAAFQWAILETNRLVLAERRTIEFVVITGDFGLENVELPPIANLPGTKNCECPKRGKGKEGPIAPVTLREAAEEAARDLDALLVRHVYLVPGNNDLCDENPRDLHRWAEFVVALRAALNNQEVARKAALQASFPNRPVDDFAVPPLEVVDLTYTLERLYGKNERVSELLKTTKDAGKLPPPPEFGGIRLVGLDSAYFKPHDTEAIQNVSIAESKAEMDFVAGQIKSPGSYLVFTHIPDVQDPFPGAVTKAEEQKKLGKPTPAPPAKEAAKVEEKKEAGEKEKSEETSKEYKKAPADPVSSWKISKDARKQWHDEILNQSKVIAVFAGHFHVSQRDLFPHGFKASKSALDEITAAKMWVAPPLAVKYQWTSPPGETARGILLVSVATDGAIRVSPEDGEEVKMTPIWFSTLDQKAATDGDDKLIQAHAEERDGHWDTAATLYANALASSNSRTRASATQGYVRARRVTRKWWWRWGKYFPPFRWWHIHRRPTIWTLGILIFLLVLLRFRGTSPVRLLGRSLRWIFMPNFQGRARVITTTSLADSSPVALFAAQIPISALDAQRRWHRAGVKFLSGGTSLLSLPSAVADQVSQTFPDVNGINIAKYLAFVFAMARYFTWRVESQLAYCPDPAAKSGTLADLAAKPATPADPAAKSATPPLPAGLIRAFATVRWGWFVQATFQVTLKAAGPLDSERAAYAIAARVLGAAQKKKKRR